jgi:ribonuclease P/MRP protein subunit RPP1
MRKFIDLHLIPSQKNREEMIKKSLKLGYTKSIITKIQNTKVNGLFPRIDIVPRNLQDLMTSLNKFRYNYQVISVLCVSKKIAKYASKDSRVDVLKYPINNRAPISRFTKEQAKLATENKISYEVDSRSFIQKSNTMLTHFLRQLKNDIQIAQKYDIPVVMSSGATTIYEIREPRALSALLCLIEISIEDSLKMISSNPQFILDKNKNIKLKEEF